MGEKLSTDEILLLILAELKSGAEHPQKVYLERISRDMREMTLMFREVIKYMKDAEAEVTEKMRRFMMYMHDVHDVTYMYEERGLPIPQYIARELERVDDRYRQLLKEAHTDGGVFDK